MDSAPSVMVTKGGKQFLIPRSGALNGRPWFFLDDDNYVKWSLDDLGWQSRVQGQDCLIDWVTKAIDPIVNDGKVVHLDLDHGNASTCDRSMRKGGNWIVHKILHLLCMIYLTVLVIFICLSTLLHLSQTIFLPFSLPSLSGNMFNDFLHVIFLQKAGHMFIP